MFKRKLSFGKFATDQVEKDLKKYCLRHWGKWWATSMFMNKAADDVYTKLRWCSMAVVIMIISNDDKDYQKYIDMHEDLLDEFGKNKRGKVWLKK